MIIFDVEADGLLDQATKIHVLSWTEDDGETVQSTNDYSTMRHILTSAESLCGHNIVRYDIPLVEKLLGISVSARLIDTLPLSWYINHKYVRHGLDDYGSRYGVPKPKIDDWENLSYEEYAHRCQEDVKINSKLWKELAFKLKRLYRDEGYDKVVNYLTFKMQCAADQERLGWRLDVPRAEKLFYQLTKEKEEKETALIKAMPKKILMTKKEPPKNMYKKDGSLSAHGERWTQLLRDNYLPSTTMSAVTVKTGEEDANPNSNDQVKDWLFSLGWQPATFKYVKGESYGEERKIPQVRDGSDLCESVLRLTEVEPAIGLLDGLTVLNHRLGIVKGYLDSHVDGWLRAEIAGLTNTFRFRHKKPLVNLPGVDKPYGEDIRGCLLAPEGENLIGCDMVSLEDTTKRHYMQPLDPDYVEEMSKDGFDPHLDLAKHAGAVTQEQIDQHNAGEISLKDLRKGYKAANYACVYGVGKVKLARTTGLTKFQAEKLIDAYWNRNWAVKDVAESRKVREIEGESWIYNDVSGFWHSLRYDKDRWSTTNQSTGVYCFDTFVALIKNNGVDVIGQFHDEVIIPTSDPDKTKDILDRCCTILNDKLKLNVPLGIDYEVGDNYAAIH